MNKLASIQYLRELELPTICPRLITSRGEAGVIKDVDSFYYDYSLGWVLRCASLPNMNAKIEGRLPWGVASSREELVEKAVGLQGEIGERYYVFCHEVQQMIRGGVMLIEGNYVVVEAASGSPHELSAMFRGNRDPEQRFLFKPGMLSFRDSGEPVLTIDDLYELRRVERSMDWEYISALTQPVSIEFSRLSGGQFYVHDIRVV